MTSIHGIICLIIVVFCTSFRHALTDSTTRKEVDSKLICTSRWQTLKLNWLSTFLSLQDFASFWSENEKKFKTETVQRLLQTVIYPHNFSNEFSCYGNVTCYKDSLATWNNTVSFNVQLSQLGSQLIGVRLLSLPYSERHLEFYLRPRADINELSYNLSYCSENVYYANYPCPTFGIVPFTCISREENVYGVPGSAGLICQAFTGYINVYATYRFHICSTTRDGSTSKSADFRIYTKGSVDGPITQHANQGKFTVVERGRKPGHLLTKNAQQRVELKWQNTESDRYRLNYSCSNGIQFSEMYKSQTYESFPNKDFAPYSLCKFCVESQVSAGSLWSEPACNTSRLPEQPPSKPPTITCNFTTCAITDYPNETRAVTIECKLPDKTARNGLLNKLLVKYWSENNTDAIDYVFTGNLSSCEVTLRGLSKQHTYAAQMLACNSRGCSDLSEAVEIAAAANLGTRKQSETIQDKLPFLAFLVLVLIIPLVALVWYHHKSKTKPKESNSFPTIEEPNDYEAVHVNIGQFNEYEELAKGDANENVIDDTDNV